MDNTIGKKKAELKKISSEDALFEIPPLDLEGNNQHD
jgi:hypothetical protein